MSDAVVQTDEFAPHCGYEDPEVEKPPWVQAAAEPYFEKYHWKGLGHRDDIGWFVITFVDSQGRTDSVRGLGGGKRSEILAAENPEALDLPEERRLESPKPVLYIDLDGVLADYDGRAEHLSEIYEGPKDTDDITWHKVEPHFFRVLPPVDGGVEAFHKLREYYETYILSRPSWDNVYCWSDKRLWVGDHLGEEAEDRLILAHNKSLLTGDLLVDDRKKHAHGFDDFIHFGSDDWPDWNSVLNYLI